MKIIQICSAHIEQGAPADVYGLGEDGNLYIWMEEIKPVKGQRQKMEEVPEEDSGHNHWMYKREGDKLMRPMVDPITKQQVLEPVFSDGNTEGWKCLGAKMSKTVTHPEDPSRHDRS